MTAVAPVPMAYTLDGQHVFAQQFTVVHLDGSTEQLWIVPATDALPCGRGLLASIDGLQDKLLKKHDVTSMPELHTLERRWGEEKARSHGRLDEYLVRQAEIRAHRHLMTAKELALDDKKRAAIIAHYDGKLCTLRQSAQAGGYSDAQFVAAGAKQGEVLFARMVGGHFVDDLVRKYGPVIRREACSTELKRWVARLKGLARPQRKPLLDIFVACGVTTKELISEMAKPKREAVMARVRTMSPGLPPHEIGDLEAQLVRLSTAH